MADTMALLEKLCGDVAAKGRNLRNRAYRRAAADYDRKHNLQDHVPADDLLIDLATRYPDYACVSKLIVEYLIMLRRHRAKNRNGYYLVPDESLSGAIIAEYRTMQRQRRDRGSQSLALLAAE